MLRKTDTTNEAVPSTALSDLPADVTELENSISELTSKRDYLLNEIEAMKNQADLGVEFRRELLKSEYEKIKEEQLQRISIRNNIFLFQIGAIGAIASYIVSSEGSKFAYLIIPWVSSISGWMAFREDKITEEIKEAIISIYQNHDLIWDKKETRNKFTLRRFFSILLEFVLFIAPSIISIIICFFYVIPSSKPNLPIIEKNTHLFLISFSIFNIILTLITFYYLSSRVAPFFKREKAAGKTSGL